MNGSGRGGFTLLEVAVALAILGVGVVTCFQIFGASVNLADRSVRQTSVVRAARANMDQVLGFPCEAFTKLPDEDCRPTEEGFKVCMRKWPEELDRRRFGLEDEVTQVLFHVQISVEWQDSRGSKTYAVESLRMLPGQDCDGV